MRRRPKSAEPRIERAGAWLYEAHRARDRFAPLPADLAPRNVADAYAIQSEFVGMRAASLGQVTGYKIALTTPAMRAMVGLGDSIAGDMMESTIRRGSTRVRAADYVRLLVEFEIAVELAGAMRAMVGLGDSIAGDMMESTIRRGSARVRAADYVRLLVEFAIAV